jgi:hypothetical protein
LPQTVLEVNGPDCVAEEFESEIVALNMETGTYFSIKDNAASLWQDLARGHPVEALVAAAGEGTPMAAAIEAFATAVVDEGLMRAAQAPHDPEEPMTIAFDGALPAIEAFNDMQSLLLLDPVHEVDEQQGWPNAKGD